jgi:predicted DNA-binding protein with PD1-like motif
MKTQIWIGILLLVTVVMSGQQIEHEPFFNINTPDSIKHNPEVPDVFTTSTTFKKVLVSRLKHDVDILEGLQQIVRDEKIQNAVIITGIGSATSYHIHVVDNNTFPTMNVYIREENPVDITNITGYIVDGRVHTHITLSDENEAIGGHLEPGTRVFTFCIITIGILEEGTSLKRFDDKRLR